MAETGALLLSFLVTAWLHAVVLLGVAWVLERLGLVRGLAAREWLWRCALLLPLASAAVALSAGRGAWRVDPGAAPAVREVVVEGPRMSVAAPVPARDDPMPAEVRATQTPAIRRAFEPGMPGGLQPLLDGARAITLDPRWPGAVAFAWLALALGAAGVALLRLRRFRARLARLPPPDDIALRRQALWIARRAGLAPLALAQDPTIGSPVAVAPDTIGLPTWASRSLDTRQRAAMLAHEVAHLLRRDPQWRLAQRALTGLLPTPLGRLALRRLDQLAELQCDAWAVQATGDARALAECLALCLEHGRAATVPEFAVPMAAAESPLVDRVRRLIEEQTMPMQSLGALRRIAIVAVLAGATAAVPHIVFGAPPEPAAPPQPPAAPPAAPQAPGASAQPATPPSPPAPPAAPAPPMPPAGLIGSVSDVDLLFFGRTLTVDLHGAGYALKAKAKGQFSFNAAEDDIATLDGSLEIEEQVEGVTRTARFEEGDGRIERHFEVDGEPSTDAQANRAWLARAIPAFLRATGHDAEARVGRLVARGGADAVLGEVDHLRSSYVRATYLAALAEQATLDLAQQDRYLAQVAPIDSDYERRRALEGLLEHESLDAARQRGVHAIAAKFDSDYERRVLLESALPALREAPQEAASWIDGLEGIESSYEHRVALESLVDAVELDATAVERLLRSAARIDSDYERRVILAHAAPQVARARVAASAYAQATSTMDSDYETREALVAMIRAMEPSSDNCRALIAAVAGVDSSYEASLVLTELAARMPNDAALIEAYRAAARRLGSQDRSEAEEALDRFFET
jgi:hypothetical protein